MQPQKSVYYALAPDTWCFNDLQQEDKPPNQSLMKVEDMYYKVWPSTLSNTTKYTHSLNVGDRTCHRTVFIVNQIQKSSL